MKRLHKLCLLLSFGSLFLIAVPQTLAQTLDAVIVQGEANTAIYEYQVVGPPNIQFSISSVAFPSGNVLPPSLINAIQWTDPLQPPPNVNPPIFFYQFQDPLGVIAPPQLQIGNLFGAMGFIDGVIDLNQPPGQATFDIPPQVPPGNVPNDPIQRAGSLGAPQDYQDSIIYHDPGGEFADGLHNTIIVGLALPGTITTPRGILQYGQANAQSEPGDPNMPGGNGEYAWIPAPAVPDPCIDDSLFTEELLAYLRDQESKNGVNIKSETEVVNFVTVRDRIESYTHADDGFTYVTVVEDHVTTAFYRFPTGTPDPKGIVPIPGDFDMDGDVDGEDFMVWQRGGSPNPFGPDDLVAWQQNYGFPPPAPAATAVPEPSTWGLLLLGIPILWNTHRLRRL